MEPIAKSAVRLEPVAMRMEPVVRPMGSTGLTPVVRPMGTKRLGENIGTRVLAPNGPSDVFGALDQNGDGVVNRAEFMAGVNSGLLSGSSQRTRASVLLEDGTVQTNVVVEPVTPAALRDYLQGSGKPFVQAETRSGLLTPERKGAVPHTPYAASCVDPPREPQISYVIRGTTVPQRLSATPPPPSPQHRHNAGYSPGSATPPPPYAGGLAREALRESYVVATPPVINQRVSYPAAVPDFTHVAGAGTTPALVFPFKAWPEGDLQPALPFASPNAQDALILSARGLQAPVSPPRFGQQLANDLLPPVDFKFYKDYNATSQVGFAPPPRPEPGFSSLRDFPAPQYPPPVSPSSPALQEVAMHDARVAELSTQPHTASNLDSQIQELLEGQEAMRYELGQVKMQVTANYNDLEQLRHDSQQAMQQYSVPPSPLHSQPVERDLGSPPAYSMPQEGMSPPSASPPPPNVSSPFGQSGSPSGVPPSMEHNALRNLGYHQNHETLGTLHTTLSSHASNAIGKVHGHATKAMASASSSGDGNSKKWGCV